MKTDKYEVTFRLPPSRGGQDRKVTVDVVGDDPKVATAHAVVAASLVLDAEGIDRWTLVGCTKALS